MFSKQQARANSTTQLAGAPATASVDLGGARKPAKIASGIAADVAFEGAVIGEGELHVDGVVRGDVRVARLTLGETGCIEGSVQAETIEARGRIVGSVVAKNVRLYATAYVDGDITHEQLSIENGAFFQGRSLKFQRQAQAQPVIEAEVVNLGPAAAE